MQVDAQKLSPVLLELAITIDAERVTTEMSKAYQRIAKSARISGFRKGKAPRQVLTHMYGARVARDVAQQLVEETYEKALADQSVQAVSQPALELQPLKEKQEFLYKARVEIVPQIEAVKYEGFKVEKTSTEVTEDKVDEELQQLRLANSTLEPPKEPRAAKTGDIVTIDFVLTVDGEEVPDGGSKDFEVELGVGRLLPDLENALIGKNIDETAEQGIEMPETHPNPALKGKTATFHITLKDIKERVLPEADDEFAKDLGDYGTLEELKNALKADIAKKLEEQSENDLAEKLVAELVKANPIEVPPALVSQQDQVTERETLAEARARGQQLAQLPPDVKARIHADSQIKVRAGLLMAEIAKAEKIKIGDPELEEGLKELAEQSGKNIAKLRAEYRDPKRREMLIGMILENKVLDIIQSKAEISTAS